MRALLPLLLLAGCGSLHALAPYRDGADTGGQDTGTSDTGSDTSTSDTGGHDTGGHDTGGHDTGTGTTDGTYTGTFTLGVAISGIPIPIDNCTGPLSVDVAGTSLGGSFDATCAGILGVFGDMQGQVAGTVSGSSIPTAQATLGMLFSFDTLTGSLSGTTSLSMTESGTVSLQGLGNYDFTATFSASK
jgi:hypothetical protein